MNPRTIRREVRGAAAILARLSELGVAVSLAPDGSLTVTYPTDKPSALLRRAVSDAAPLIRLALSTERTPR